MTIRVVVADDHPVYRQGLGVILGDQPEIELVGFAADGQEALALVESAATDVVLLDLHMPTVGGIETTVLLARRHPEVAVLILTMDEDDERVLAAIRAGARGYLVRGATGERIVGAIRAVAAGEAVFGAAVTGRILGRMGAGSARAPAGRPFPELTEREFEVLDLMAAGRSNSDIVERLFLSEKTIRNLVSMVFTKLHVPNRAQAIVRGRESGLGRH